MSTSYRFLIIDGYSKQSRDDLAAAGMELAWKLYANMLEHWLPESKYDILLPSDEGIQMPASNELRQYHGIMWTGCNLCINDIENPSVVAQIELAKQAFEMGIPSWGSCWGIQMAVVAAGGEVAENPKGREMGIARKISLTPDGIDHPLYEGKSSVFEAYISHDDMVIKMPVGGKVLSGNDYTAIQSAEIIHKKGTFWAVQYHPEYDLHEMASLIVAREEKLTDLGFFKGKDDFSDLVNKMKALFKSPDRKDLRWQLAIDNDVLDINIRQCEFKNWINNLVLPHAESR